MPAVFAVAWPAALSLAAIPPAPPPTPTTPVVARGSASGSFHDRDGVVHPWAVTSGHILQWDGAPYMPVGGVFEPRYWADGQTEDNWNADVHALAAVKSAQIDDLYLYAGHIGLTAVPAAAVQKVLDYLDANGFHYGIEIADNSIDPLSGYVIKPSLFRRIPSSTDTSLQFTQIDGMASAIYTVASVSGETGDDGLNIGAATVDDTTASVNLPPDAPFDPVVLLYPNRVYFDGSPESHLPDLWQGYDNYRDHLLTFFSHIHFGKGFRFFIDPFVDRMALSGDEPNVVPTSDGFQLEFQAWLQQKYPTADDLNQAWGVKNRDLPDFATAARCIPLWFGLRGVPVIYDPVKHGQYAVLNDPTIKSRYWADLDDFKLSSIRAYMNSIADVLKGAVADVPVVFKCPVYGPLYINDRPAGGFDGIGIEAFGEGRTLELQAAANGLSAAEASASNGWLMVSDTAPDSSDSPFPGGERGGGREVNSPFPTKTALFSDWDALKEAGARGIFAQALQRLPDERYGRSNLAASPDALQSMAAYAQSFQASANALSTQDTRVLWYPAWALRENPGVQRLSGGIWWLPSSGSGRVIPLGEDLRGYVMGDSNAKQPQYVVWSPGNTARSVRFMFDKKVKPVIADASGTPLLLKDKGGVWTIPISAEPILISHVPTLPLPVDVIDASFAQAQQLIAVADAQKIPVMQFKDQLFYAENSPAVTGDDEGVKFNQFESIIGALTAMLCPYAWIEGEGASRSTFDSLVANPDASEGAYLSLDTEAEPPSLDDGSGRGYMATYGFTVNSPGKYTLWMSGSDLNSPDTSPFAYSIDGRTPVPIHGLPSDGAPYGGMFYWTNLGDVGIEHGGNHTLTFVVSARRRSDDHFALLIDAICITRVPFKPDGITRPPIAPAALPAPPHSKNKPSEESEPPMIDSEPDVNIKADQ